MIVGSFAETVFEDAVWCVCKIKGTCLARINFAGTKEVTHVTVTCLMKHVTLKTFCLNKIFG